MNLYLLRHGDAEAFASSDRQRSLTPKGRNKTKQMALWFKGIEPSLELVMASPYLRTQQTAEIFRDVLKVKNPLQLDESLALGAYPAVFLKTLSKMSVNNLLLVSHQPFLGSLAAGLIMGDDERDIPFKKNSIMCIEMTQIRYGEGSLKWFVIPKILGC